MYPLPHHRTVLAAVFMAGACRAEPTPRPVATAFTPAELSADVDRIESALREGNPALHAHRTPAEVDSIFRAMRDAVRRPMSALEFWKVAARAVAGLRDNHTSIVPSGPLFEHLYRSPGRALPLAMGIVNGRLFVLRSYLPSHGLDDGTEVITVDGVPAADFLAECARYVPTDGRVGLRAARRIERDFDLTCGMAAGLPATRELTVLGSNDSLYTVTVPTVPWRERRKVLVARAPGDTLVPPRGRLSFTDDSSIAILTVRSFSKQDGFDPKRFIDDALERIRASGARALIIDVRANTGGKDTHAARLFAGIARDTFTYYTRRVVNKRRFEFLHGTDDWMINYMAMFLPMDRQPDGRYRLRMALDKPMKPAARAFDGPVVLMVDGNSVSTSSELASVFKARRRGTIIGEESGSALGGGTGADVSVVLPNTALVLNVPIMYATIDPRSDLDEDVARGVIPDVVVEPSVADRLARRDVVLDSALVLVRRGRVTP